MSGDGWLYEMKHYDRQRAAYARQIGEYQQTRPPVRLTERGEFVFGVALLSALVIVGWALLWMVAG